MSLEQLKTHTATHQKGQLHLVTTGRATAWKRTIRLKILHEKWLRNFQCGY